MGLLPEIGPDGIAREAPVIAYTEKIIEEGRLQLKKVRFSFIIFLVDGNLSPEGNYPGFVIYIFLKNITSLSLRFVLCLVSQLIMFRSYNLYLRSNFDVWRGFFIPFLRLKLLLKNE